MGDPEKELERAAAKERSARDARRADREAHAAAEARAQRNATKSRFVRPDRFLLSKRFFLMVVVAFGLASLALANWLENVPVPASWFAAAYAVWALWFGWAWLDAATWKRRLPFRLSGFAEVRGRAPNPDDYTPYIRYVVTIEPRDASRDAPAVSRALEILAHRVDRMMEADTQAGHPPAHRWRVDGHQATGTSDIRLYGERHLELWLRGPARVLHRAVPIARVRFEATLTGDGYRDLSSTD